MFTKCSKLSVRPKSPAKQRLLNTIATGMLCFVRVYSVAAVTSVFALMTIAELEASGWLSHVSLPIS